MTWPGNLATHYHIWFTIGAAVVLLLLEFGFYLITPRLLLDLPFKWRDLVPGAAACRRPAPPLIHTLSLLKTSSLMLEIMEVAERRATVLRPPGRRLPRLAG
jgi:hypothetical protein